MKTIVFLTLNTSRNSIFRTNWDIGSILAVSYTGCDWATLIKCVDLSMKGVDLSAICCTHWVDVLVELL